MASILKSPQPLSDEHCQFFIYQAESEASQVPSSLRELPLTPSSQILRGLKFMHSAGVIHRGKAEQAIIL